MQRVVSLYLPTWPTDRLRRRMGNAAPSPERPLVLAGRDGRRRIVAAVDRAAQAQGLYRGLPLSEAQARVPGLHIAQADPAADAAALERLAAWVLCRYSPLVALDAPDGLLLDICGVAHLFGDERRMLRDLLSRLRARNIRARAAAAETVGAAHALARFAPEPVSIAALEDTAASLAPLPLAALRLAPDVVDRLRRLGFESIADLAATPRAPLHRRLGPEPGRRLDQAFGRIAEPMQPIALPELIHVRRAFAEPIAAPETLARYTGILIAAVCPELERQGLGARRLDLLFHRVDGAMQAIRIGTARPVRDARRLARLFIDRLEAVDPGFGVEVMTLAVPVAEPLRYRQNDALGAQSGADMSDLVDTLANRLGAGRLYRMAPVESDLPERSVKTLPPLDPPTERSWPEHWPRPSRLLPRPEPVATVALLPDYPPAQFTWRGVRRRVRRADGPERVFGEWWRHDDEPAPCSDLLSQDGAGTGIAAARDYFVVEDEAGARFWLFRSGDGTSWYMHGVFG